MENRITGNQGRKKFILLGTGALAALATLRLKFFSPPKKSKMVKMLTKDGQLVEIDQSLVPAKKEKIKVADIHNWISKR